MCSHLARKFVEMLRIEDTANVHKITDADVLCVEMAGLIHDLGKSRPPHAPRAPPRQQSSRS